MDGIRLTTLRRGDYPGLPEYANLMSPYQSEAGWSDSEREKGDVKKKAKVRGREDATFWALKMEEGAVVKK